MSSPAANLLAKYSPSARKSPMSPNMIRSPMRTTSASPLRSPRQMFSDSEYVANRVTVAALEVEIRTLKAELSATQHALDNARSELAMKSSEMTERERFLLQDMRRRQSEHEVELQRLSAEKERVSADHLMAREDEHRKTVHTLTYNHGQEVASLQRESSENLERQLAEQRLNLEEDYRRALARAQQDNDARWADQEARLEQTYHRRMQEMKSSQESAAEKRESALMADMAAKRTAELELLQAAHQRQLQAQADAADSRLSQMLVSQKTEFERKIQQTEQSLSAKEDATVAKLHKRHAHEVETLRRAHSEDRSNLENQLEVTRRVKEEEKILQLRAQEAALEDNHQKELAEQNMLYKRDLIDMQQTCNEEVATVRGRTLLELGASPRYLTSPLMPRIYSPERTVLDRPVTASERLLRSASPLRRGGLF